LPTVLKKTPYVKLTGWRNRINKAKKTGKFTYKDRIDAGNWLVCACGERSMLDECIDRKKYEEFEDSALIEKADVLGQVFSDHVDVNDFEKAQKTLEKIENMRHIVDSTARKGSRKMPI